MTLPTKSDRAKFREETRGNGTRPIRVTVCSCGWSTTKRNNSFYGGNNDLDVVKLAHRIDHLEGRVSVASDEDSRES